MTSLLIFVVVAVVALSLLVVPTTTIVQAQTNKTIAGLTAPQVFAAEKVLDREERSAHLHNASQTVITKLTSKLMVFQCANDLIRPNGTDILRDAFRNANLNFCDVQLPTVIEDHSLGNNQTLIKVAYEYLKIRGIQ